MAISESKETVRVDSGIDQDGTVVREKSRAVETRQNPKSTFVNAVWYIYGVIAILLALRFVLKLTGANPANGFVNFIYAVSGVLSAPFDSIFGVESAKAGTVHSVFEPSILVAILIYALIAWGIAKLITLNERRSDV
jgi:hypothetical protein